MFVCSGHSAINAFIFRAQCSHLSSSRQSQCFPWLSSLARLHPWYTNSLKMPNVSKYIKLVSVQILKSTHALLKGCVGVCIFCHRVYWWCFNRSVSLVLGMRLWLQQLRATWWVLKEFFLLALLFIDLLKFYHLSLLFINQGAFVKALQKEKAGDGGDGKDAPEDMALD